MVKIKNLNKTVELKYQTEGSVGIDVCANERVVIGPGETKLVDLGVVVETPENCMTMLVPRSSLFKKKGLLLANSVGIIDRDYCGENDVVKACFFNPTDRIVVIDFAERICQLVFVNVQTPQIEFVDSMSEKSRGGFGSTDRIMLKLNFSERIYPDNDTTLTNLDGSTPFDLTKEAKLWLKTYQDKIDDIDADVTDACKSAKVQGFDYEIKHLLDESLIKDYVIVSLDAKDKDEFAKFFEFEEIEISYAITTDKKRLCYR